MNDDDDYIPEPYFNIQQMGNILQRDFYKYLVPTTEYSFDDRKLGEWYRTAKNCYIPAYVPDELKPVGEDFYKSLVYAIYKYSEYVSWKDFYKNLIECFKSCIWQIYNIDPSVTTIGLFVGSNPLKSNFWLAKHFLHYIIQYEPTKTAVICEELQHLSEDINHVVFIDDAAFSGMQIYSYIRNFGGDELGDRQIIRHAIIPYMTHTAKTRLGTLKNIMIYNTVTMKTLAQRLVDEGVPVWDGVDQNPSKQELINTETINYILLYHFSYTRPNMTLGSKYRKKNIEAQPPYNIIYIVPLYFQHKIPDNVSSLPTIYATGKIPCHDKEPVVFINKCQPMPGREAEDGTKAHHRCAEPFYKQTVIEGGSRIAYDTVLSGHHLVKAGILVPKRYIIYNKRRYRIKIQSATNKRGKEKEYIMVDKKPVFLSDIKGKYKKA